MCVAALNHARWLESDAWPGLQEKKKERGKLFLPYCNYSNWIWAIALIGWGKAPAASAVIGSWTSSLQPPIGRPGGEWEESSPHPLPVAECVNVKTLSLPIIWVTPGFGVCLRARVRVCVCVCGCRRENRDKEREKGRERRAAFLLPPLASPSPCSLSLHPSSPSPGPPSSPAPSRTETPPHPHPPPTYHPDHPGTLWLSSLLRPCNHNLWAGKTLLISAHADCFKSSSCPLLLSSSPPPTLKLLLLFDVVFPLTCFAAPCPLCFSCLHIL